jgi:hypothetical protein
LASSTSLAGTFDIFFVPKDQDGWLERGSILNLQDREGAWFYRLLLYDFFLTL